MTEPLLRVEHLSKQFGNGVTAAEDVSFQLHAGETLGIVGESGCGKTTTARLVLQLLRADAGRVLFDGVDLGELSPAKLRAARAKLQLVPQNPQMSLNPRLRIGSSIKFHLRAHHIKGSAMDVRVSELLDQVGVGGGLATKYPHELSGGQLQRVAIARALSTHPKLVVCDEAVSALDKSVQAQVLNLLAKLQDDTGVAYLFISHDLAVVEHFANRVAVMYHGRIVEHASARELWKGHRHPYTEMLLSSIPGRGHAPVIVHQEPGASVAPMSGCSFRPRCPIANERCECERPELVGDEGGHAVACLAANRQLVSAPV